MERAVSRQRCSSERLAGPWRLILGLGVLVAVVLWGLTGCSSVKKGDGAPRGEVDFDRIPDAVPRAEPKSPYGNPVSYEVFGQRYYPLESSRGYVARGVASWYGTQFHGKLASSREPYDMYAMTGAHKTLPLPTYARVTNLENGRSVVVRINDRGPFQGDRIIDLSYVAAGKLRMLGPGTASVEVRALIPGEPESPSPPVVRLAAEQPDGVTPVNAITPKSGRAADAARAIEPTPADFNLASTDRAEEDEGATITHFYVQAGAFGQRDNAERLRVQLSHAIPQQVRVRPTEAASPTLYRVQVGPLTDRHLAESVSQRLADLGVDRPHLILE